MSKSESQGSAPTIVDLDELFCDEARELFENIEKQNIEKRIKTKLSWEDLRVTLDYKHFVMETEDHQHRKVRPMKQSSHVVFKTTYSNTTTSPLNYTLSTERTTRNISSMRLNKSLSHSASVGLKFKLPAEICELEGGYSRELTMEKERETTREEEMVWSANTEIKVPPRTNTTMELVVEEQEYDGTFECLVRLSGKVLILIHKGETEVCRIIAKDLNKILPKRLGFVFDDKSKTSTYKLSGTCLCRKGLEQSIKLSETPIQDA